MNIMKLIDKSTKSIEYRIHFGNIVWISTNVNERPGVRLNDCYIGPIKTFAIETRLSLKNYLSRDTLEDRKRKADIIYKYELEDIIRYGRERRRVWNEHVNMASERLAKIAGW
ncbi:hypothetical protein WA026_008672 [Henosepilachna vigintioctopunctata]|uniref:Uncharacterized protein n=1 Tax=Henosepilachna vigintioctopunctata TaxID=420089 RepID=A0AAW1V5C9_9CUCU